MAFAIEWMVYDGEWEKARAVRQEYGPGVVRDENAPERLSSLYSAIQLRHNEAVMFSEDVLRAEAEDLRRWPAEHGEPVAPPLDDAERFGWTLPLVHLADGLAWRLIGEGFLEAPDGTETWYRALETNFYLSFAKRGGIVAFTSSWERSPVLRTTTAELEAGVRRFIGRLLEEIGQHAPALLEWEAVQGLKPYAEAGSGS